MGTALIICLIVAAIVGVVLYQARKKRHLDEAAQRSHRPERQDRYKQEVPVGNDPWKIQVGYELKLLGDAQLGVIEAGVRGVARYRSGSDRWLEYLIQSTTGDKWWLGVEDDDGDTILTVWTDRDDLTALKPDQTLTVDGLVFTLSERGEAIMSTEGTTGLKSAGKTQYVDYTTLSGGRRLSFERFQDKVTGDWGSWYVSTGVNISLRALEIMPAGDVPFGNNY